MPCTRQQQGYAMDCIRMSQKATILYTGSKLNLGSFFTNLIFLVGLMRNGALQDLYSHSACNNKMRIETLSAQTRKNLQQRYSNSLFRMRFGVS